MKRILFDKTIPKELLECVTCQGRSIHIFVSEKVKGYVLLECMECGAYSEIMDVEMLEKYVHQQPKKIADGKVRWVSQTKPKYQAME